MFLESSHKDRLIFDAVRLSGRKLAESKGSLEVQVS